MFIPTKTTAQRPIHRTGVALLQVLLITSMLVVITMTFVTMQSTTMQIATNTDRYAQARTIAESALASQIQYIKAHPDWLATQPEGTWTTEGSLLGANYTLQARPGLDTDGDGIPDGLGSISDAPNDPFTLTATATYQGASYTTHAEVHPTLTGGRLLMMVGNASNIGADDLRLIDMFDSWGWVVTTISDETSQSDIEDMEDSFDVIFVSTTTNSSTVGYKLDNISIGAVAHEVGLHNEWMISGSHSHVGTDSVNITNNTHYITEPFNTGLLKILNNIQTVRALQSPWAGAETLAIYGADTNRPTVSAFDYGVKDKDGNENPGRRVILPWSASADPSWFNDDGKTILKRSLEWAAATPPEEYIPLTGEWFDHGTSLSSINDIDWSLTPDHTELLDNIAFDEMSWGAMYSGGPVDHFGLRITGQIKLPSSGDWKFRTRSDDGVVFWINGTEVINHDSLHGTTNRDGSITLSEGTYDIEVKFFENMQVYSLELFWSPPGSSTWETVPPSAFNGMDTPQAGEPVLLALYDFKEEKETPNLIGHWKFDDAGGGGGAGGGVAVGTTLFMKNDSYIDSYNSSLGDYGGSNKGSNAKVMTNSTSSNKITLDGDNKIKGDVYVGAGGNPNSVIDLNNGSSISGTKTDQDTNLPFIANVPSGASGSASNLSLGNSTVPVVMDYKWNKVTLNKTKLQIHGHRTIIIKNKLEMDDAEIILMPGARLDLYVGHNVTLKNKAEINDDSSRASDLNLYMYGSNRDMLLDGDNIIAGRVYIPDDLTMKNKSKIYGLVHVGGDITMEGDNSIHQDISAPSLGTSGGSGAPATVADESTIDNPGSPSASGVTAEADGKFNKSFEFDGNNGYIEVSHQGDYLLEQGSVSFWVYPTTLTGQQGLVSKDSEYYDNGGHLHIYLDGNQVACRIQSTTTSQTIIHPQGLSTNSWYHVVATWGPTGLKLYLDNHDPAVDFDRIHGLGASAGWSGNEEPWVIGASSTISGDNVATPVQDYFEGRIDDVRIYDTQLQKAQIASIRSNTAPGEVTSPVIRDTSGYGSAYDLHILEGIEDISFLTGGGMDINGPVRIRANDEALKIIDACKTSNQITIEAHFTPANLTQDGPANIVSISNNGSSRNVSLGQEDDQYSLRVRTTSTSGNGTPSTDSADVLTTDQLHKVIITYNSDGKAILYRNGNTEKEVEVGGTFNTWDSAMRLIMFNEHDQDRPWQGTIKRIAIYDSEVNELQVDRLNGGESPGLPLDTGDLSYHVVFVPMP